MRHRFKSLLMITPAMICAPCLAWAAPDNGASGESAAPELTEVVVTARRKSEALSTTPVAITAFSSEKIESLNVHSTRDLQRFTPGVVFSDTGSGANNKFFIRGQGQFVIGGALPSVLSYLNEVPLGAFGSVLSTYDVDNIQILKGPQGTLFGRNTTGGAVLVYSKAPSNESGGYVEGLYGSKNWVDVQGAVNVPIVEDKLSVRIAGELQKRDGYTKNLGVGADFDDIDTKSFRVSVMFKPNENIKNTLVYDYFRDTGSGRGILTDGSYSSPNGQREYQFVAGAFAGLQPLFGLDNWPLCKNPIPGPGGLAPSTAYCNVDAAIANQKLLGPRQVIAPVSAAPDKRWGNDDKIWGFANTTEIDLGAFKVKNIIGYRADDLYNNNMTDGLPFILLQVVNSRKDRQFSEEIQFSGTLADEKLDWLAGAFYLKNRQPGALYLAFDAYRDPKLYLTPSSRPANLVTLFPVPGLPQGTPLSALLGPGFNAGSAIALAQSEDTTHAFFGQVIYHFDGAMEGLSATLGARRTSDEQAACSANIFPYNATPPKGTKACLKNVGTVAGFSRGKVNFNATTWNAGLDYKVSPNLFLYGVARRGYRSGGLNTPALGGALVSFQSYEPQYVQDFEIGAKTHWRTGDMAGVLNIALYHDKYKNFQRAVTGIPPNIDRDNNPGNDPSNTTLFVNNGGATVKGLEVDGSIFFNRDISISYSLSHLDFKLGGGAAPGVLAGISQSAAENAPRWSYGLGADWRLPFGSDETGKFVLHGDYYWVDDYNVGLKVLDAHGVGNVSLDWRDVMGKPATLTAFVENVTDKVYKVASTLSGSAPGFHSVSYGPPRMYGVRLRYKFGGG